MRQNGGKGCQSNQSPKGKDSKSGGREEKDICLSLGGLVNSEDQ